MDITEKDIRNLFADSGELDRDEVAMLLLQLLERIQNLEKTPQRTWVGLTDEEYKNLHLQMGSMYFYQDYGRAIEAKLKEKNT